MRKIHRKGFSLLSILLLSIATIILIFNIGQYFDAEMNTGGNDESQISCKPAEDGTLCLAAEPEDNNYSHDITWYLLPLDLEFTPNVYMHFIKREPFYFIHRVHTVVDGNDYIREYTLSMDKLHYEIGNTSDYYYTFGQLQMVAKLVDGEWFGLHGYGVAVLGWAVEMAPHAYGGQRSFEHIPALFPEGYAFDGATYKLIKPATRYDAPRNHTTWAYLIVQLD